MIRSIVYLTAALAAFATVPADATVIHYGPNEGYRPISSPANLVYNGDFNVDPLVDPSHPGLDNPTITGWTVTPVSRFPNTRNSNAGVGPDGRGLSLGEFTNITNVSQTLNTSAGAMYQLSFFLAVDGEKGDLFRVLLNSSTLANLDGVPYVVGQGFFSQYIYDFTASSPQTALTFQYLSPIGFQYLSNVTVLPIPEPAGFGVLLAGFVGMAAIGGGRILTARRAAPLA